MSRTEKNETGPNARPEQTHPIKSAVGALRAFADLLRDLLRRIPGVRPVARFLRCLRQNGWAYTQRRVRAILFARRRARRGTEYPPAELERQRKTRFARPVRISVLVPLYRTPKKFLTELIASVQAQTYADWELCLADGSGTVPTEIAETVRAFQLTDPRIRYRDLGENRGIAGNTNAAAELATGEYFALLDHDDLLHPAALYEVARAICERNADFIYTDETTFRQSPEDASTPHYKPDFSPDLLRSCNYICHLTVFSRSLMDQVGAFDPAYDGSQDYDMILRLTERARNIVHIPRILYYWRASERSTASGISVKPYTVEAAKRAIAAHLARVGLRGTVTDSAAPSTYRVRYEPDGEPLISILIPNMDHTDVLDRCIRSVEERSTYRKFEILLIENNSRERETFSYYERVCGEYPNIRVLRWEREFNYSAINNFGAEHANGEYLLFLNNDVEIITPSWMEEMLMFVQRPDVGAAGMMLYYPDNTVQHAGVILGIGGVAGHSHKHCRRGSFGYFFRMSVAQDLSAVTAACMMVKATAMREVNGFDPELAVAYNDVDFCMKLRRAGYRIVFNPYAEGYHYESKSRGREDTRRKRARFEREGDLFRQRWKEELDSGDPYYNPNLSLLHEDFRTRAED